MVAARNKQLYAQGQAVRADIRSILEQHSPLLPPLTAKSIRLRLRRHSFLALRTIQWHLHEIRSQTLRLAQFKGGAD
jgi:hypothetical protein